jgi:ribosomal protein L31E
MAAMMSSKDRHSKNTPEHIAKVFDITIDKALSQDDVISSKTKKTTAGWEILVSFSNGETQWLPLRTVKESNPVELAEYAINNELLAEYAINNELNLEPAFHWWVPDTISKQNRIIKKVKAKYWRTTHKFGIRVPKSVEEAVRIDNENGNRLWQDAIEKEMKKAKVSYNVVEDTTPSEVRANECDTLRGH